MALPVLPIAAGAAQVLSGLLGGIFASGDKTQALRLAKQAYEELAAIGMPPDLSQALILEKFKEAGVYSPELEQEIKLETSKVAEIQEDPTLRDAAIQSLEQLREVSRGGLRPEDRAAYNQLRSEAARDLQGKIGQIQQSFQARGQGGQGAELAAQLMASQEGANRQSAEGDRISADASRRALEAISSGGQFASQLRGQDFDIAAKKASAADEIARFNASNAMAIQARNIAAKNAAQRSNLENKQRVMDANTLQANDELRRQQNARRQLWADMFERQRAISGAKQGLAGVYSGQAQNTAQAWQGIGSGVGGTLNAWHQSNQQNKLFDLLKQNRRSGSRFVDYEDENNPFKYIG